MRETIFAVSSGAPPAAIAVIRVSGEAAGDVARALTGSLPPARRAVVRDLCDADDAMLDRALVLWFPGDRTATGEPIVEFHVHGGRATIDAVQRAIVACPDVRPAEPGEFTRRALANGRIDLTQAEGLADLLTAETEGQRRAALLTAEGTVARLIGGWRERVVDIAALVEAQLDFDDEGDVAVADGAVGAALTALADDITSVLALPPVERLHHGATVVLAGPPNSGKSSLINALSERDAAIVTDIAGTTRDAIEVAVKRDGAVYRLIDTAGLRSTNELVEKIGVERARRWIDQADLVLWLGDDRPTNPDWCWIGARCDILGRTEPEGLPVSVREPATIARLWDEIVSRCGSWSPLNGLPLLNERQRAGAASALQCIVDAQRCDDLLVVAELLRVAVRTLDQVIGATESRSILDAVFSRFCIGK